METFQAETKNIKTITRVVAILVLANFVILAVVPPVSIILFVFIKKQ